ncbi:VWA domain-containing protein [Hydrogenophaga sp.]|uniref:VWA domain-containing protein n=1 Tax=Hydrogenophaga sp. TaxID=1904254 RepID=UPI0027211201|nr:VWA domain-containing protein [Hydrogenophaga sp.]MDO9134078.1 VWA domain-containing protein [Hydrogenophaga sp.]
MTNKPEIAMVKKIIAGFVSLLLGRKVGLVWGEHAGMLPNGNIMLPPPTTGDAAQIAALTRMAVHEAGHSTHTDPGCMQRLDADELLIFNLLEDPRMEMEQRKQFAGAGLILSRGLDEALDTILGKLEVETEEGRSRALQLDILLRGFQAAAPQAAIAQRAQAFYDLSAKVISEHQRKVIDAALAELPSLSTSLQAEELAIRLNRELREQPAEQAQDQSPDESPDQSSDQPPQEQESEPEPSPTGDAGAEQQDEEPADDQGQGAQPEQDQQSQDQQQGEGDSNADTQPEPAEGQEGGGDDSTGNESSAGESESGTDQDEDGSTGGETSQPSEQEPSSQDAGAPQQGDSQSNGQASSEEDAQADSEGDQGQAGDETADGAQAQSGESADSEGNGTGDQASSQGGQGTQGDEVPDGEPQAMDGAQPASPTMPSSKFDLGDMLREAYEAQYGKPQQADMDKQLSEADQGLMAVIEQALEQGEDGDADLDALVEAALAMLVEADQAQPENRHGSLSGAPVLAAVPCTTTPLDIRLDGVQSRLVRVLLRELQDRRRRPAKYAQAGGQVAVNRFWRLGKLGDTKVFRVRKSTNGVDAAVKLLLDRSGSMEDQIETAAKVTLAFSLAMQRIGNVTTSVAMFPGTHAVTESLQSFGQPAQQAVRRSEEIKATGSTPTGQAVVAELPSLLAQRKEKHVLVVITDDGPDDPQILALALAEAEKNGVEVIGVGIGCDIRAFITNSVTVSSVDQLPDALEALFRSKVALRLAA